MALFSKLQGGYEDLWKSIIRPPREEYEVSALGPVNFILREMLYQRTDLELTNDRGQTLQCSHFEPVPAQRPCNQLPCVVYLHANCSSRVEALMLLGPLLPVGITVFAFDFAGCGMSEGEYVSLGWFERDDLACVVDYLRRTGKVSYIGLWGRSMGAVTALLHAHRDHSIAGLVLDSPFSSLYQLAGELANEYANLPNFVLSSALGFLRKTIKQKANFDIKDLSPLNHAGDTFMPALFGVAKQDSFISPSHSEALFARYGGEKHLIRFEGDHNTQRPESFLDSAGTFFYNALMCEQLPETVQPTDEEEELRKALQLSLQDH